MSDLRTLHRTLVGAALVTTPPYEAVVGRARRIRRQHSMATMAGVALVALLASTTLRSLSLDDAGSDRTQVGGGGTTSTSSAELPAEGDKGSPPSGSPRQAPAPGTEGAPSSAGPRAGSGPPVECRKGANGGASGQGVTADRIHLLGAAQLDGPAKTLVEDVPVAWKAVIDAVNRGGGICGRTVTVSIVNRLLDRPVDLGTEDVVGMLLGPLDPDIGDRLRDGSVDRWALPIVGGDGDRLQFSSSSLWPVDLPTAAFARIGADEAYRTGARTFAVVYDDKIAADAPGAVAGYVGTLAGAELRGAVALDPDQPSYSTQARDLREACGQAGCDAVVLALLPETAKKWFQADGSLGTRRTAAWSLLLTKGFGNDCALEASTCERIRVWTGMTPPTGSFVADPDVARYADDMGEDNAMNPATESAYVAAQVMVAALQRAGPRLDRASLRAALDELPYRSGLVSQLDWGPRVPDERVGNRSARAVRLEMTTGAVPGFVDAGTGWVGDPWPGRFPD